MNREIHFFATAARGLGDLLAAELRGLGARDVRALSAGVGFAGDLAVAYRVCLWSRLANRILMPIARFQAPDPEHLYRQVHDLPWEEHLGPDATLAVDCTAIDAAIGHSRYAALKVKDAIVDRFRERTGARPSVDVERPDLALNLHLRGSDARLAVDLSGGSLHRRGYRSEAGAAPLKENLAAAILLLAGWPEAAAAGSGLLDPLCGSGTLVIEAALMAADSAPGLLRGRFGFEGWLGHRPELWQPLLEEAQARRAAGLERLPPLFGYDADPEVVAMARANVARAGVDEHVVVACRALGEPPPRLPARGLLVANPPYGERLGEATALRPTYAALGELLRRLPDWRAAVLTGNPELAGHIGLKPSHDQELFNGPIACRLFHYPAASEHAAGGGDAELAAAPGAVAFANRLRKNLKHLSRWARREGVECWRAYDQDLPEYAFAVDLYRGERLWVHVQEYSPPATVDPQAALRRTQEALAVLPQVLEIPPGQLFFKQRRRQKGSAQYSKLAETGRYYEVREGGLRFLVNFTDYLDTGLFLDHRLTRGLLREQAAGKRFLNLFAYTGTATVHAAAGGAAVTTSVDLSRTYLDWAQRNLALNGLAGPQHRFIQADCLHWLEQQAADRRAPRYDLIFLDPPTFSASKRMDGTLDVQRDHVAMLRAAAALLATGGELVFSNNYRGFRLDSEALDELAIEDISARTIPEDFRRRPTIHRCWRIKRRNVWQR